ncbi:hypothetical protein Gotur_024001 [Gossypium turneri]
MQGLAQCEFSYKGDNYKKKVREISNAWNQTYRMKIFVVNPMMTPKYSWWRGKRINDNISASSQEDVRPIKEHLQLEEEKMHLGLDVGIHKLGAEKLRKEKNKAEEELGSLKINYKKLHLSMRAAGLGKTSNQW